jgi:FAD:protein FMN transferase
MSEPTAVRFAALGTHCEILCTAPVSDAAAALAQVHLAALDKACSRFRPDSEAMVLADASAERPGYAMPSPLFLDYLAAALEVARLTDGLVDPTVGAALVASGYDDDIAAVRARASFEAQVAPIPGWQSVRVHKVGLVGTPQGCLLDFGSSAKAHAADRIAADLAASLPGGFLVNLGGDMAVSGDLPEGGWPVAITDAAGADLQVVATHGQAITTSSSRHRTWTAPDGVRHHIIDPRTGGTAEAVWAQVSVCADTALLANAASTAAIILGDDAPAWLAARGISARLDADGDTVFVGGWPRPDEVAPAAAQRRAA